MPVERKHRQHLDYLPYGECFFERRDYWNTPYKYPSMSPYMYCAGNPVILVDPDGKKIKIVWKDNNGKRHNVKISNRDEYTSWKNSINNNSGDFAQAVLKAMVLIDENDCYGVLDAAIYNKKTLKIKKSPNNKETASRKGNTLEWNFQNVYVSSDGEKQAPVVSIYHDMAEWIVDNLNNYSKENEKFSDKIEEINNNYKYDINKQDYDTNILMIRHFEPSFINNLNKNLPADKQSQPRSQYYTPSDTYKTNDVESTKSRAKF